MHIYQQLNIKNKLRKQKEQRQNHGQGQCFDGYQMGGACGRMGEKVWGLRNTNTVCISMCVPNTHRQLQSSHGNVKYMIRNWLAKECVHDPCT